MTIRRKLLIAAVSVIFGLAWSVLFVEVVSVVSVAARGQTPPAAAAVPSVQPAPVAPPAPRPQARQTTAQPPASVAPVDPTRPTTRTSIQRELPTVVVQPAGRQGGSGASGSVAGDPDSLPRELFDTSPVLRIGQDYTVSAQSTVREVVVITGSVTIDGHVAGDLVVVLGTARLGPTAIVDGDFVTVAGAVTVAPGAQVKGDFVVVGGGVDAPPEFSPGGEQVVIGAIGMGDRLRAVVPWVTGGLFLGRVFVPSLPWMWSVLGVVFLVYLLLNLLLERPVRACADVLMTKPLSTFLVGLLVLLFTGPVVFILVVSLVGVIVLPFAACALVIAWLLGKVGVSRAIGASLVHEAEPGNKLQATRSFAIGFAIICFAYAVPVLGFLSFVLVAVFGLGSASMALKAGLRRENPAKPKPPRPVVQPVSAPSVTMAAAGGVESGATSSASPYSPEAAPAPFAPAFDADPAATAATAPEMPPVAPGSLLSMPKAAFAERAAAFGLDVILVSFVFSILEDNLFRSSGPGLFFLLLLIYHIVFWTTKATTVGGIICNLRLVRTDGGPVTFSEALVRGLSSIFSFVALGLGCLWILRDPERQAWHDRFAGTYVVKVPRHWPL